MRQGSDLSDAARSFASEYDVDVESDIRQIGVMTPVLAQLDGTGRPNVHITDASGADYYLSRIDYYGYGPAIRAFRAIAIVMPGYRTKLAYYAKSSSKKVFTVHRGAGYLIIGGHNTGNQGEEFMDDDLDTAIFPLDPDVTPQFTIPPGKFYTIEAADWSPEPLVISGLSKTDANGKWESAEITIEPGEEIIMTPDGMVEVPDEFFSARFD